MINSMEPFSIDRESITDRVYTHIKKLILSGYLKGGEKVPEEKVAAKFKVSRTPVREALRRLEKYGLIYIKPRSYAVVVKLDPKEIYDICVVRFFIEKLAFSLFCEAATPDDLAYLRDVALRCSRLLSEDNQAEAFEADSHFHLEIARRSGNAHLYEIVERLDAKVQLLRLRHLIPPQGHSIYTDQHERMVTLLGAKKMDELYRILEDHVMHDLEQPE